MFGGRVMRKKEFVEFYAECNKIEDFSQASKEVDKFIEMMKEALTLYPKIVFRGFGTFEVKETKVKGKKLYLSVILDAYGRYVISYNISSHPNFNQIKDMLEKAFKNNSKITNLILHSDAGWQYQKNFYIKKLEEKKIIQSMSRMGNVLDNGLIESFFSIMKSEMFYGQESSYKNIEELKAAIDEYIDYYNNRRIKLKLKGLTPVEYRNQSL